MPAVFVQLGLAVPSGNDDAPNEEPAQPQVERAMFNLAISLNRLRNKEGTGYGRPWEASVTDEEARFSIESMSAIAEFLLAKHANYR
ncbi:abortive infection family protein [Paraburkholderia strydomiana]